MKGLDASFQQHSHNENLCVQGGKILALRVSRLGLSSH